MKTGPRGVCICLLRVLFLLGATGGFLRAAEERANSEERVVELPPFIVDQLNVGPPWHYVSVPGMEVLARVEDGVTSAFVRGEARSQHLLDLLLPRSFQEKGDAPEPVILYSQNQKLQMPKELMDEMMKKGPGAKVNPRSERIDFLPNLRLMDKDFAAGFVYLQEGQFRGRIVYTPAFVRLILEWRTPQLPSWFIEGFVLFYAGVELRENRATITEAQWLNETETERIKKDPEYPRALLPMRDILACGMGRMAPLSALQIQTRNAQTVLFIRWALSGGVERKKAFWKFVERSCLEAPTEKLFMECFGFGYADARDRLSDMLSKAVQESVDIDTGSFEVPEFKIREATVDEITRIKGDWQRMQIGYVKKVSPQHAMLYEEQAWNTLSRIETLKNPAPELAMVLGFFECERANEAVARRNLEAAVKAKVARPRAYLELARLRLIHAKEFPEGSSGKISKEQMDWVIGPLTVLETKKPEMMESYILYATALNCIEQPASPEQLAVLSRGVKLFPKSGRLVLLTILLHLTAGDGVGAAELLKVGLGFCEDRAIHERLLLIGDKYLTKAAVVPSEGRENAVKTE